MTRREEMPKPASVLFLSDHITYGTAVAHFRQHLEAEKIAGSFKISVLDAEHATDAQVRAAVGEADHIAVGWTSDEERVKLALGLQPTAANPPNLHNFTDMMNQRNYKWPELLVHRIRNPQA